MRLDGESDHAHMAYLEIMPFLTPSFEDVYLQLGGEAKLGS